MFPFILIDGLDKLNQERSPVALYHILTGKRSSQTIQDTHIFQLKQYFGIYKNLDKSGFKECIYQLERTGFIKADESRGYLTEKGRAFLEREETRRQVDHYKGLDYDRMAEVFFDRLILFIQLASNLLSGRSNFIPIIDKPEILSWTRDYYQTKKKRLQACFDDLYHELHAFLLTLTKREASVFVDRLTGVDRYGLSKHQIKDKYGLSLHDTELLLLLITHKLISWIRTMEGKSTVMAEFLGVIGQRTLNTESAEKTYALLEKGFTIEEITKMRRLRESTIYDHIVEIAYRHSHFDISPYMEQHEFDEIAQKAARLNSKKLRLLNEALEGKYSYFQLRLVLAVQELQ